MEGNMGSPRHRSPSTPELNQPEEELRVVTTQEIQEWLKSIQLCLNEVCATASEGKLNSEHKGRINNLCRKVANGTSQLAVEYQSLKQKAILAHTNMQTLREKVDLQQQLHELKQSIAESSKPATGSVSFADMVKKGTNDFNQPISSKSIAIYPSDKSKSSNETKILVQKIIRPDKMKLHVRGLRKSKNGGVIISTDSKADIEKLKQSPQLTSSGFTVDEPYKRKPRIVVIGVPNSMQDTDVFRCIYQQNLADQLQGDITLESFMASIKLSHKSGKKDAASCIYVIEVPARVRKALISKDRVNDDLPVRGQMEHSPLYVHKEFEIEDCDEWEVHRSRVHLGALIGSGAFGRVHAAQLDMPGGETITVAAKMLSEDASEEEIQDFLREIVMLKHVGFHKHVIRLIGCCTKRTPLVALLEHAPRGDLLSLLRAARGKRKEKENSNATRRTDSDTGRPSEGESEYTNFSDSDPALSDGKLYIDYGKSKDHYVAEPALRLDGSTMREYALQVALGMRHLEDRGITHRDLAARNILVDGAGTLKVADFGLSRSGIYVHTRSRPVPLRWLAPEAIIHSQYCSASDVWAFGVLLWEIATLGGFPYAELSNHQVPSFLAGGGRLPKPARASPRLYQLMEECWSETADSRPTFAQIVEKLQAQKQLYVDLECVFPTDEDALSDFDFNAVESS